MKLALIGGVLVICAGQAMAQTIVPAAQVHADPLDSVIGGGYNPRGIAVYDSLAGPFSSFGANTGMVGYDDYGTAVSDNSMPLAQFKFVGGVTNANEQATFNFYTTSHTLVNTFSVAFPQGGAFTWTVTFGTLPDGGDSTFMVPNNGFVEMVVASNATGRFFMTTTSPSVGTNDLLVGSPAERGLERYQAFGLIVAPAPGSLGLLALGGLAASRRRR
jgi:hypothetical protein